MKKYIAILMAIACAAALLLTGCGQNNDPQPDPQPSGLTGSVATDGSTSMQKVINTLGEAFMNENKGITFTYNPTGSGSGIKAVQEGRCDIGLSSRALKAEEKEAGLKETVLAYDGIAIIVNPENPVSDLTLEQIADIYTGRITNWKDLGGNDAEIVLIGREAGSGTRDGFETITGTSDALPVSSGTDLHRRCYHHCGPEPRCHRLCFSASIKDTVKALSIGGIVPTEDSVKDGSYAIQRPFVLVTVEGRALSECAQKFFEYITSSEAASLISAAGAVAAN